MRSRGTKYFRGHTSADYSENQYIASILAGYDHPFGNVTVGPRLGLAFSYEDFGSVKEEGDTGLELRYNNLNQTSVQSSLGVQASIPFETAYGGRCCINGSGLESAVFCSAD